MASSVILDCQGPHHCRRGCDLGDFSAQPGADDYGVVGIAMIVLSSLGRFRNIGISAALGR